MWSEKQEKAFWERYSQEEVSMFMAWARLLRMEKLAAPGLIMENMREALSKRLGALGLPADAYLTGEFQAKYKQGLASFNLRDAVHDDFILRCNECRFAPQSLEEMGALGGKYCELVQAPAFWKRCTKFRKVNLQ